MEQKIIQKIVKTKQNYVLNFSKYCYYRDIGLKFKEISDKLKVNYRTQKRMENQYNILDKIHSVTPDKALKEQYFSTFKELELFSFLIKDTNYFLKYNEVNKQFPISRYFYKRVRDYISENL